MYRFIFPLPILLIVLAGCKSEPLALNTYDHQVLSFPDDFPNDQPILLAFLNANDRPCDLAIRPLRALSARGGVYLVGVMTYSNNAFVEQISSKSDIVFPIMLDPTKKMFDRFGVNPSRCPVFLYLSPNGDVVDRQYDLNKVKDWYKSIWIDKALKRPHRVTTQEEVERTEG